MKKHIVVRGQTIIEVVVALGAGVLILTSMIVIIITSLNNAQQGSSESQATSFAEQGMEVVRQMKDNNFPTFNTLSGSYCMAASCSALTSQSGSCGPKTPSCPVNIDNKYIREVAISRNDSSCRPPTPVTGITYTKVTTIISWRDTKCTDTNNPYCHSVKLESCLSNYGARTAP